MNNITFNRISQAFNNKKRDLPNYIISDDRHIKNKGNLVWVRFPPLAPFS